MVPDRYDRAMHMLIDAGLVEEYWWSNGRLNYTMTERGDAVRAEMHDSDSPLSPDELAALAYKLYFSDSSPQAYRLMSVNRFEVDGEMHESPMTTHLVYMAFCPFCDETDEQTMILFQVGRRYFCMSCCASGNFLERGRTTVRLPDTDEEYDA